MRTLIAAALLLAATAAHAQTTINIQANQPDREQADCVYNYEGHKLCGPGVHPATPPQFRRDIPPGSFVDVYGHVYPPTP